MAHFLQARQPGAELVLNERPAERKRSHGPEDARNSRHVLMFLVGFQQSTQNAYPTHAVDPRGVRQLSRILLTV
jgi:hypothetical protein